MLKLTLLAMLCEHDLLSEYLINSQFFKQTQLTMSSSQIGTTTANNDSGSGATKTINSDSSNQRIDIDGIQIDIHQ